jgi:hypothetical protein
MPGVVLAETIDEAMQILTQRGRFPDDDEETGTQAGTQAFGGADSGTIVNSTGSMIVKPPAAAASSPASAAASSAAAASAAAAAAAEDDSGGFDGESGTMVVTGGGEEEDGTMKSRGDAADYRPAFLAHFDNKRLSDPALKLPLPDSLANITDLRAMAVEDLRKRLSDLQPEMDKEIADLRARYQVPSGREKKEKKNCGAEFFIFILFFGVQAKRQPIIAAIEAKKNALHAAS